jgi:hypothetical protein
MVEVLSKQLPKRSRKMVVTERNELAYKALLKQ